MHVTMYVSSNHTQSAKNYQHQGLMIGSLGKVVDEVFSFSEFVSLDVFGSVFFTFEVTDSGVVSI